MSKFSNRIQALVQALQPHQVLIDIGCDHGYLGILALKTQKVIHVINVDLHPNALNQAQKNFHQAQLTNQATFVAADGFCWTLNQPLKSCVAVLAGMGSNLILQILEHLKPEVEQLVFLTHTLGYSLRKWALKHHWGVLFEDYVCENNRVYELISLTKNHCQFFYQTDHDCFFGLVNQFLTNVNLTAFVKYWTFHLHRIRQIPDAYQTSFHQTWCQKIQTILHTLPTVSQNCG